MAYPEEGLSEEGLCSQAARPLQASCPAEGIKACPERSAAESNGPTERLDIDQTQLWDKMS